MNKVLAYDLGTGGVKACLYSKAGELLSFSFKEYKTYFPIAGYQEQKPADWWSAVVDSTNELMSQSKCTAADISAIGVSGHSLGVVAISKEGKLVSEYTPIWSDTRAERQAKDFFKCHDYEKWYMRTGGGFPAHLYSVFKIKWYIENFPDVYETADVFLGSKDYINFLFTGIACSDFSYASGCGAYDLISHNYVDEWLTTLGISKDKLPKLRKSTDVIGTLTEDAASVLHLLPNTPVVCGGVDNACMALGAGCYFDGKSYTSLGTSAWIAVSSDKPVLDLATKPYVFEHCVSGQYVSANCIFSAGNTFRWVKNELCGKISLEAANTKANVYEIMTAAASEAPTGSEGLIFLPALAGGSTLDPSENLRGGLVGLNLSHTLKDIIRASMEGVAFHLRTALEALSAKTVISNEMLIVGGGANSSIWMQIFADIYNLSIITTDVGQSAGALGAAALAAFGVRLINDFDMVKAAHTHAQFYRPNADTAEKYNCIYRIFQKAMLMHSELDGMLKSMNG